MTQLDYRKALENLVSELRWRVDTHHNDGENLDGEELTAFQQADELLNEVKEPSAAVSTGSAPVFPLGFNTSKIPKGIEGEIKQGAFDSLVGAEEGKCQFMGKHTIFPPVNYYISSNIDDERCTEDASWEVQENYGDSSSPVANLCSRHLTQLPFNEKFYRIRRIQK